MTKNVGIHQSALHGVSCFNLVFLFLRLMKLFPCLSHCFSGHIMGLNQQWTLVILHNLDLDRVVSFLFLDALNNQIWISRL